MKTQTKVAVVNGILDLVNGEDTKYKVESNINAALKNSLINAFVLAAPDDYVGRSRLSVILQLIIAAEKFQSGGQRERLFPEYSEHEVSHSYKVMSYMYQMLSNTENVNSSIYFFLIMAALCHDFGMTILEEDDINKIKNNAYWSLQNKKYNWNKVLASVDGVEKTALAVIARSLHHETEVIKNKTQFLLKGDYNKVLSDNEWNFIFKVCYCHGISIEEIKQEIAEMEKWTYYNETLNKQERVNFALLCSMLRICDLLDISVSRVGEFNKADHNHYNQINSFVADVEIRDDVSDSDNKCCISGNKSDHPCSRVEKYVYILFNEAMLKNLSDESLDYNTREECETAYVALLEYFEQIESELKSLKELISFSGGDDKHYTDKIKPHVIESLHYSTDKYQYVKVGVDEETMLSEIASSNLYGDSHVAIRELLQNAFDACRARLIYAEDGYSSLIKIEYKDGSNDKTKVFSIKDNGIGMTKEIIEKYFLKAGKSLYSSIDYRYSDKQFFHAGNFGLGVFSTFMLTDQVNITTLRAQWSAKEYRFRMKKKNMYVKIDSHDASESFTAGTEIKFEITQGDLLCADLEPYIKNTFLKATDTPDIKLLINNNEVGLCSVEDVMKKQKHTLRLWSELDMEVDLSKYLNGAVGYVYLEYCPCAMLFYNAATGSFDKNSECELQTEVAVVEVIGKALVETNGKIATDAQNKAVRFVIPWSQYVQNGGKDMSVVETVTNLEVYSIMNHSFSELCKANGIDLSKSPEVKRYKAVYNGSSAYSNLDNTGRGCDVAQNTLVYLNNILIDGAANITFPLPADLPYHVGCLVLNIVNYDGAQNNRVNLLLSRNDFAPDTKKLIQTAVQYAVLRHLSELSQDKSKYVEYVKLLSYENNFLIKEDAKKW